MRKKIGTTLLIVVCLILAALFGYWFLVGYTAYVTFPR